MIDQGIIKKIIYRANYRGMQEIDILMRRFVRHVLPTLNWQEVCDFEKILEIPDQTLWEYITQKHPLPDEFSDTQRMILQKLYSSGG